MEILGIDFGGSGIKAAPVNINTGLLTAERHRIETPQPATPEAVGEVIDQLIKHFNWKGKVGIGFPAAIQKGIVKTAANIDKSWINTPVDQFISEKTGCKAYTVNDADAAGIAEMAHGAGKNKSGVIMVLTVGTGIGTAIFNNGQLLPNTEIGHLQFKDITIEKYASDATRKRLDLNWKKWGTRFSKVVNHYENLFYPDMFILGGGISRKYDKFEEYLDIKTPLLPAKLLNDAGIIGAAMYAAKA